MITYFLKLALITVRTKERVNISDSHLKSRQTPSPLESRNHTRLKAMCEIKNPFKIKDEDNSQKHAYKY